LVERNNRTVEARGSIPLTSTEKFVDSVVGMSPVITVVPLGSPPWPTIDPFLFCVHHQDSYPVGNAAFGPDPRLLRGRSIGSDFSGTDGWSMYHGSTVPGFPQHPHRGFETVTFVKHGLIDHADSLGAGARYGNGDVQWLTAGAGIVHAEMFPLLDDLDAGGNATDFFQIWVNLPKRLKMSEPYFAMLWADDVPVRTFIDSAGRETVVTVAAGALDGTVAPPPPPDSWASQPGSDVAIWRIELSPDANWTMPAALVDGAQRVLYVYGGSGISIDDAEVAKGHAVQLDATMSVSITAGPDGAHCLLLQGVPIGEPVAQHGPFVMNDRAGIEQAFSDYQRTGFGGWPWPDAGPVHGHEPARFARRSDGSVERPANPEPVRL
jgi:quercetin 2,3-dioxygenase